MSSTTPKSRARSRLEIEGGVLGHVDKVHVVLEDGLSGISSRSYLQGSTARENKEPHGLVEVHAPQAPASLTGVRSRWKTHKKIEGWAVCLEGTPRLRGGKKWGKIHNGLLNSI
jgi:hypothetical protein